MDVTEFDHLVLMLRCRLTELSPPFEQDGYKLTDLSVHNLGSMNRLITLDNTFIELLGWPAGKPPQRKEIADSPMGLEALVFRTYGAQQTYEKLKSDGFDVNPVQRLERPLDVGGKVCMVRFDTVRFATQPVAGFRVYFCQSLTPEYIWTEDAPAHRNGVASLDSIVIKSDRPAVVAQTLSVLVNQRASKVGPDSYEIQLPNIMMAVQHHDAPGSRIAQASVANKQGDTWVFDTHLNDEGHAG